MQYPNIQNDLTSISTSSWAMILERCVSSGRQGKHLVEDKFSAVRSPLELVIVVVTIRRR
jgi:hypothetical protein